MPLMRITMLPVRGVCPNGRFFELGRLIKPVFHFPCHVGSRVWCFDLPVAITNRFLVNSGSPGFFHFEAGADPCGTTTRFHPTDFFSVHGLYGPPLDGAPNGWRS